MATGTQQLQQFYTTNSEYILSGLRVPPGVTTVIEPFCGAGDLIRGISTSVGLELYDIDPKHPRCIRRDTLLDPPNYQGKYVITNPPYLSRNKSTNKTYFQMYKTDDLYKCFLIGLIRSQAQGGQLVVPSNFICSQRAGDVTLRSQFCEMYWIDRVNMFETPVFNDTNYSVCAFSFLARTGAHASGSETTVKFFPSQEEITVTLTPENNYSIGTEVTDPVESTRTVERATTNVRPNTRILIRCIDNPVCADGRQEVINAKIVPEADLYIDTTENQTARTFMSLRITPDITLEQQLRLVTRFNQYLAQKRAQYKSLFLVTYREYNRKRIAFETVYRIIKRLLNEQV